MCSTTLIMKLSLFMDMLFSLVMLPEFTSFTPDARLWTAVHVFHIRSGRV